MTGEKTELSAAKQMLLERRLQGALKNSAREPAITRGTHVGRAPLSFAQQRLWFLEQLAPGSPVYNINEALRLHGALDVSALERSLREIIRRHEALRTNFIAVDGQPVQVIAPASDFKIEVVDLRELAPLEREPELQRLAEEEARRPFDLTRDLMLRATLLRLTATEHVLLLTMHHIASDAWSIGVLYQELSQLYEGFTKETPATLPELPIQYADYAVWQREWMQGKTLERELAYWKEQLAGAPEVMNLPTDHTRPARQSFRGTRRTLILPVELSRRVKEFSHERGVTLFMTLLSAFKVLLQRYSRQDDVVVDSPIAGRNRMETEGLIGFFVNTLVLRTRLSGQMSFSDVLANVRKTTLEAYAHQELPFERLVEHLHPERSLSIMPFVQTMFVVQNSLSGDLHLPGVTATPLDIDNETSKFDLTLTVTDQQGTLAASIEYNSDLYDAATISRMLGHYQTLLDGALQNPDQLVASLPLLSSAERHQLLFEWNNTSSEFPRDVPVHRLFERQAERTPDECALVDGTAQLTYRELNARANQLAHYLEAAGAGPGKFVGLYLERSADLIVTLLAILKSGAAYVPFDQSYPRERIAFMLDDAKVQALITERRFIDVLPANTATRRIYLDEARADIWTQSGDNPVVEVGSAAPAYVIYTSGSTGKPKGVVVPHRAINRLVINTDYVQLKSDDVVGQISNSSFDAATWEIWGALLNGARLVMVPKEVVLSTADFHESIRRHGITAMFLTSALFNQHVSQKPSIFEGIRHVMAGGEALDVRWIREALQHGPPQRLVNGYGPTETTTFAVCHEIREAPENAASIPIGHPIANTAAYVLDEQRQPVPIGVPGELYIGGDGVAGGYLNRPELTQERFVPDPFSTDPEARLYRTGDLVRYLNSGVIEFLGRMDQQVKIRGFRIELGEIEAVLGEHPSVRQCAVAAWANNSGPKRLAAYVVPKNCVLADSSELRAYLGERLPEYMVPSFFVPITELPLSPNGKVNRAALTPPDGARHESTTPLVAPQNEAERRLQSIWQEVLGVPAIGTRDKFFDLGGHSLLAVKLAAQIEKVFGKKLSVATIFQYPTIHQLAELLRDGTSSAPCSSIVEIQPEGSRPPIFFVHGVGGGMFWGYTNLARHLGADQPVYAFRSRGLDGGEEFDSIEEMAAHYVADLLAFQPKGPYYLGGYCFGGNVAYEMARLLENQGHRVGMLALINSGPPNSSYTQIRWTPIFALKFCRNLVHWGRYAMTWTPEQRRSFVRWKVAMLNKAIRRRIGKDKAAPDADSWVDLSAYSQGERKLWEDHIRCLMRYHPKPYSGAVTLFRSPGHPVICSFDDQYGWGDLVRGGVDVHVVSSYHESILEEPHVVGLATMMSSALRKAQVIHEPPRPQIPPSQTPPSREILNEETDVAEVPLAFAQHALWQLGPGQANMSTALGLEGPLSVAVLEESLKRLVRRHSILRTRFINRGADLRQAVLDSAEITLDHVDTDEAHLTEHLETAVARRFNLAQPPLLRAVLHRVGTNKHVLLLTMPALAADEHSLRTLQRELAEMYNARLAGRAPTLPELSISYARFAARQRASAELVGKAYGEPVGPSVPTDRPAGRRRSWRARVERLVLPKGLFDALKKLSQREAITLFLTLVATTGTLVYRHTRQDSFTLSTNLSGRARIEVRNLIGLFTHMCTLGQEFSGNPRFSEILRRSRRNDGHDDGFVKSGLRVLVSLENALDPFPAWTRLHTRELQTSLKFVPYDLGFRFVESADELLVDCIYNTDLFERTSAQRWLARMKCLLEAIVANPDEHIADLAVMPESERAQVVRDWNSTDVSFPLDRSYTGFFEARAGAMPNAPAVRHRDREWSYAELNRRANRIAHYLQDAGIGPEAVVGVCMDRSLDLAAVLLGVLKAGAAYLPLDPAYPQERLDYMIADSGARLLLTQSTIAPRFASQSINMFSTDDPAFVRRLEQPEWDRNSPCPATASSLAYVIYTSGSTGKSKGVEITRRSLLNHNLAMARIFGLSPADRVLQFTALSFDISVEEMFPSWLSGCAVIMRSEQAASIPEFFRFIEQERISILNMPTAFWHAIVDALPSTPLPACLRLAVIGGEKASLQHYLKWQQHAGERIKLVNTYGPTETTVTASVYIPGADARQTVFPIGRPIANTRMYVLNERQQPVPIGVPGELYIGGEGVARGYLNRPELNAERFLTNSFTSAPERMYRTGDVVRYLHDGNIEFVGRADNQIKIRGFRVEPGEVEAVLLKHPHVRQCVVAARPYGENEKRLIAWFVPTAGTQPTAGEIISFLKRDLPDYMIPFACVSVNALPLLPNGKVDQASLPSPGDGRPELEQTFVAPQTPFEETIAGIWSEVLGVKNIGIHDNFFELGGHSLHAMQVVTRLRDFLRTDVPMTTLFHASTIAALVGLLTATGRERKSSSSEAIPRTPRQGNAPLSFAQQRLWFLDQLEPNSSVYNVPQLVRIEGRLDIAALESAFRTVLTRHEPLRTHFIVNNGEPRQEIASITRFPLPVVDLRSSADEARQSELKELANQEARRPFNLKSDLLVRAKLVQLDEATHALFVTFHHVACDGWSIEIFWEELFAAYEAFAGHRSPTLPDLSLNYIDFAQWQRGWMRGDVLSEELDYWKTQLAGAPALLELPTDYHRPASQSSEGARHPVRFSPALVGRLKAVSQQENCTLFMTILAGFQALLARYSGRDDIVVGTVVANRNRPELERLIGFFANTLVLRTDFSGDPTFRQVLERTRSVTLDAYVHQDLPFEKLVEELHPVRDRSYHPIFQVMLVLQNVPATSQNGPLRIDKTEIDPGTALFDLTLNLTETGDSIAGYLQYSTDLFESETISRMINHLQLLLENAVFDPGRRLSQLGMLSEEEREQLVVEWNATARDYPKELTWVQLFEGQVARNPEATALVFGGQRLSYEQLNQRANQWAHYLRKLGVGPESLVGICAERSIELVLGILGVLKAGGAYLPMDPVYPAERLGFMLEDAKVKVLLSQEKIQRPWPENARVIHLDKLDLSDESTENPPPLSRPENLAYVIYTSGSTGKPKGVALEHRSLSSFAHWAKELYSPEELDGVLAGTSICFDLSVYELLVPLCWGGKIILATNVLQLPELPAASEVRLINTVPSAAAELVRLKAIPSTVQVINLAGEPLRQSLVDELYGLGTLKKVYDLYGPTEDTVYSTCALRRAQGRETIGRPLANKQIYILDEQMEPVPVGVVGQLYIGGDGLARGYLQRLELTEQRFIQSPWGRLYKTGDLARYRVEGNIEFIGRADHQVKIRGFRIELGEVETQLRQHPQVREAVVIAAEEGGEKRLVGYVVGVEAVSVNELKDHLRKRLPDYMVPSALVMLEKLPLTPNGKVDRKALPPPSQATAPTSVDFAAPQTDVEQLLASMWREILGRERVGIHDNFFELGGHSLMVTRLVSRLRDGIQVELPMASVFEAPTIAELSLLVEELLIQEIDGLSEEQVQELDRTAVAQ